MAHDLQQSMVVRSDYYVSPEVMGQVVASRGSSGLPGTLAYTQRRAIPPPPPPRVKDTKRRKSKTYFLCSVSECNEKFTCIENLKTHMKLHQGIKPFACNICGKVCRTESTLNVHRARHANDGEKCKCDICKQTFSSRSALKKHKLRIHRPRPHICPYCRSGFEAHRYMAIHVERAHEKEPPPETHEPESDVPPVNLETSTFCAQRDEGDGKNCYEDGCGTDTNGCKVAQRNSAASSVECQKEQNVNSCDASNTQRKPGPVSSPITCEMCTSTFPSLSYLEQHMAVHVNEKSLTCQHCDMKFTNHQLLSNHLKLHNTEPEPVSAFPENFNSGRFTQYVSLSGQPSVTRGPQVVGKYICALCSEQFLNLGSLKRHQAKGHNSVDLSI